ncbi:MAG: hypothetical protein ACJA08_001156 [Cyclobacteriaceae bacterium]|jgi:hypothetical protein
MINQITDTIMMVRPAAFLMNEETAVNNFYQQKVEGTSPSEIQNRALAEFDGFVEKLRGNGIKILVIQDTAESKTPDSIFPNNWNSFHEDGAVYLYPMFAENRRREIKPTILDQLTQDFEIKSIHSFTHWEATDHFLEGTGSMILDRPNKLIYAALSERTQMPVLKDLSERSGFELVTFTANQTVDSRRLPIYHTNVMMCLGEGFAVICLDSIDDENEKNMVREKLNETGKEIIEISEDQCNQFAGNMLQVRNEGGKRFIVMSASAYHSLNSVQVKTLSSYGDLIHHSLATIEKYGGGSARCMMAEIFLQPKHKL